MIVLMSRILPEHWARHIHAFLEKRAALRALRKQNKKIREAMGIVYYNELNVPRWKLFLEFRVFQGVQGDQITPDVIHGQSLILHFGKRGWVSIEEDNSTLMDTLVCSDDKGRWFELTGNPGQYCWIKRINAQEGADRLAEFNAIQQLALTPFAEVKS